MRCRTKLIVLCALSILGEPSFAASESASATSSSSSGSSSQSPATSFAGYSSLGDTKDQFSGEKRASAYRSEFKRLPLFTFGLGKRFAPSFDATTSNKVQRGNFAFGMGKRSALPFSLGQDKRLISRLMTTGLGKRSISRYMTTGLGKRSISRLRTTGLGKRLPKNYVMGLGKREEWKNVGFGLGKRLTFNDKSFGLGKRTSGMQFGLGRRSSSGMQFGLGKRSSSGMFGLGKRDNYDDEDDDGVIDYDQALDAYTQDKRKFDLGLGKRVMELYNDLPEEEKRGNNLNFGMGKRYIEDEDYEDEALLD
ncbi:allatostatin A-like [Phymastichus coffea]|uniref:allatostatin A-like n=1 Tax=Phymastichus coffea TaxID=108790 RepID=UPI00273BE08E|nr:allatostatin A-like [Phymastichus coffea]